MNVWKWILAVATLLLLVYAGGGLGDQAEVFARFLPSSLALAFGIILLNRLVMTWKWWQLLRLRSLDVGFVRSHAIYQASSLWGFFLPATVGADALRILCLKREGVAAGDSLASIVIERVVGLLSLLMVVGFAAAIVGSQGVLPGVLSSLVQVAALGAVTVAAVLALSFSSRFFTGYLGLLKGAGPRIGLAEGCTISMLLTGRIADRVGVSWCFSCLPLSRSV